jgi:hypothetical protein
MLYLTVLQLIERIQTGPSRQIWFYSLYVFAVAIITIDYFIKDTRELKKSRNNTSK